LIGKCSGNLFPVRASDTTPPLLSLCASTESQETDPKTTEFPAQSLTSSYRGYITENSPKEALIT
jgi:hypothetical protein